MPNKRMQIPKLPELEDEKLTPWERFQILARKVVAVPKEAIEEGKQPKDKPRPRSSRRLRVTRVGSIL